MGVIRSDRRETVLSQSLRGMFVAAAAVALMTASGCTVRPLLATDSAPAGSLQPSASARLASIEVAPVDTRYAQQVRNNLIFLLRGGAAAPAKPHYRLNLGVIRTAISAASIQRAEEEQPTAQVMTLQANYTLIDTATGKAIASGKRAISSPYDVPRQEYAVYRAEIDAENRAAKELAEVLRLTIAQALTRPGVAG